MSDRIVRLKDIPPGEIEAIQDEVAKEAVKNIRRMVAMTPSSTPLREEEIQAMRMGAYAAGPIFLMVLTERGYVEPVEEGVDDDTPAEAGV